MRIGYFPDFHPDELVYSVVARYIDHMNFPSHHRACELLFGSSIRGAIIDLPVNLNHFIDALPPNHTYTVDRIINDHTLFPFYARFLNQERQRLLRESMKLPGGSKVRNCAGILGSRIKRPMRLRYCPICMRGDQESFGESYWHRSHQLPGIPICPLHEVILEETNVTINKGLTAARFIAAQEVIQVTDPKPISPQFQYQAGKIAKNALWIMTHSNFQDDNFLPEQYYAHLEKIRLVTAYNNIRTHRFFAELEKCYPPDFLRMLQSDFPTDWMERVRKATENKSFSSVHPIIHLVLIGFLDPDIDEFFSTKLARNRPFSDGPWPCLNPHCTLYMINCITTYTIKKTVGIDQFSAKFMCQCGYSYTRIVPDKCYEDRFYGRVACYGHVWDKKLKLLWNAPLQYSLSKISIIMCKSAKAVRRRAAQLGLSFDSPIKRGSRPNLQDDKCKRMRDEWLALERNNSEKGFRTQTSGKQYQWLRKNDREWFQDNVQLPADLYKKQYTQTTAKARQIVQTRIAHTDRELAEAINHGTQAIFSQDGFPQRITKFALCREIGFSKTYVHNKRKEMTLTNRAFEVNTETDEQYVTRKLKWASHYFHESHNWPSFVQFYRCARIARETIKEHEEIKRIAIDEYHKLAGLLGGAHQVRIP